MLIAEIHGKSAAEALDNEDYLTSAVFGHLRHIPPSDFWSRLFARAKGACAGSLCLTERLSERGIDLGTYQCLEVSFWPNHSLLGQPDLVLRYSGDGRPSVCVVVEVKLWSQKGSAGEDDQLVRYLRALERLPELKIPFAEHDLAYLIYLTPRDSRTEIEETLASDGALEHDRERIFRLQWQDILDVARQFRSAVTGWSRVILSEVAEFLCRRNLEFFRGFRPIPDLPLFGSNEGRFYIRTDRSAARFRGWTVVENLVPLEDSEGGWIR